MPIAPKHAMASAHPQFIVLTGASGGGKSSIIEALAARGFTTVPEAGRRIVLEQRATGGDATPWQDRVKFRDRLFARSVEAYEAMAGCPGPVFFDRGMVEALAYSRLLGLPVPEEWLAVVGRCRYARTVLVTPPWRAVFENDGERQKTWPEVLDDYRATVETYAAFGYRPVIVPRASVAERVAFVLMQAGIEPRARSGST
ncbi:MAG: AAA family ATPase [Geminicoccaceae bacterium]